MTTTWDPDEEIQTFADDLVDVYDADLEAVLLFGSVPRGEAVEGVSDVNLLVLLRRLTPEALSRGAPHMRRWHEAGRGLPLLLTAAEWSRSLDVFPLEVSDMSRDHRLVHGNDPLEGLQPSLPHLRLQIEREIRSKLIHLREGTLLAADSAPDLGRLLLAAAPSVAAFLRGLLVLAREAVPASTPRVSERAAALLDADPAGFLQVWEARQSGAASSAGLEDVESVFRLLERTADFVDRMEDR